MIRKTPIVLVSALLLAILIPGGAYSARKGATWRTDKPRYIEGRDVVISFTNRSTRTVTMENPWVVERRGTGDTVAIYEWPERKLSLAPGDRREWRWDQLDGGCYGNCEPVQAGEQADAGRYVAAATIDGNRYEDAFDLGAYFTLGFNLDEKDLSFVVFAAEQEDVDAMRAEAEKDRDDKTMLVSGMVRKGKPYNADWSYVMGSHSIVLGEVFTEVCDAHPRYVERHRKQWMGERWCPWSSYVDHEGG